MSSIIAFNNDSNYHKKISKAFVQIKDVSFGNYLKGVGDSLVADIEKKGVPVKLLETNAHSLKSEKEIENEIKEYAPHVVILLERIDSKMAVT